MSPIRIGEVEYLQGELASAREGFERSIRTVAALRLRLEGLMMRHRVHALPPRRFIREASGVVFVCEDAG